MLAGWKRVGLTVIATAFAGAIMGLFIGFLVSEILLWTGVMLVVGGGFGVALAYGFLPES